MHKTVQILHAILRRTLFFVLLIILGLSPRSASAQDIPLLVDIPKVPEGITRLDESCNYIIDNYWKHFNFKGAFSSVERMDATLGQFLEFTPYATADTVSMAINTLITGVEKADAKNLIKLARMAEKWCGTDTAEYASEELMLPFAQAVANNKKLKGPDKDYFSAMARRMANSRQGVAPADFSFTVPDGSLARFSDITEPTVLLMFYDPEDFNSRLARTRLAGDFVVKTLMQHKLLRVVAIYPGQPTAEWLDDVNNIADGWVIGASPGIEKDFTIKKYPQFYYLDQDREITDKDFSVDAILIYFSQFIKKK